MKSTELPVNEIFYSLQGEGFHTGTPAVFVRLSGCNLHCGFCDTDHSGHTMMTVDSIVGQVTGYPAPTVVITGGEPTLYCLDALVSALHCAGRRVHIETNGTGMPPEGIDWVTCSPKPGGRCVLSRCDELKVVYTGQDVERISAGIETGHRFLQPCSGENVAEVVEYVKSHPQWRLSLQTHRLIDIP